MSVLGHILAFDLRRHRWLIAAWVLVLVGAAGLQTWTPLFRTGRREFDEADLAITIGWLAQILLAALLVPLLVHTHAAVGTMAFWLTRPFPPSTVARSKLLLLFTLFIVVPAVCDATMMAFYGVPGSTLLLAVVEASLKRGAVLCVVLPIAVLTRNLAQFAVTIGAILVALAIIINIWLMVSLRHANDGSMVAVLATGPSRGFEFISPDPTPETFAGIAAILFGVVAVFHQYRTRATRRTIAIVAGGLVVMAIIANAWPWPVLQARSEMPAWAADPSSARLVTARTMVDMERVPEIGPSPNWRIGRGYVFLQNVPAGWVAMARLRSATVSTSRGEQIMSEGIAYGTALKASVESGTSLDEVLKTVLGVEAVAAAGGLSSRESSLPLLVTRPRSLLDQQFSGSYRGEFAVDLAEMSVAGVLPLGRSATLQSGALRITVLDARWFDRGVHVRYRMSDVPTLSLARTPADRYEFYLRSAAKAEATQGHHFTRGSTLFFPSAASTVYLSSASPFYADTGEMTFSTSYFGERSAVQVDESWMTDAELVIVRVTQAGPVYRTLEIPQLVFAPSRR